ncbi:hypothetical protein QF037_006397 [Streptomyces canus]|uniref:hypothetical protein n=1 Tax=Streptomyces canus TaxID=58343 RepID=UPI002782BA20|nr:hypothetical protein [Streptomyces canus]MDQ0602052.1 hypothetical protein [Streptomyces canus]
MLAQRLIRSGRAQISLSSLRGGVVCGGSLGAGGVGAGGGAGLGVCGFVSPGGVGARRGRFAWGAGPGAVLAAVSAVALVVIFGDVGRAGKREMGAVIPWAAVSVVTSVRCSAGVLGSGPWALLSVPGSVNDVPGSARGRGAAWPMLAY